jgi:hypothetical protein
MKVVIGAIGFALVLTCGAMNVPAQTAASNEKPSSASTDTQPKTYRLTYTVTELDGAKHIGTQHYAMTIDAGTGNAQIKLGSRVPIATGSYNSENPANAANVQFQYLDVGLNIAARVREFATGMEVVSKLEQSGVAEEKSSIGVNDPVIRQATLENTALLTLGKPVMLGALDVPGSTRHLDIEVVLEAVK